LTVDRVRVLMVTGAYFPELSGGGLQARAVVRALRQDARFLVITTSIQPALPAVSTEDDVPIYRIHVNPRSRWSKLVASIKLARLFASLRREFDIVNLHGFSTKAVLLRLLARVFHKRFILTLQPGGHDSPEAAAALGRVASWAYRSADLYLSVSPGLSRAYLESKLAPDRLRQVCNAVDIRRFRPADEDTRNALREKLGLPRQSRVVLFVGYFSADKRPDALFDAWSALPPTLRQSSMIVYVGATESAYSEIDPAIANRIRRAATDHGLVERLHFVESTLEIEDYFRASDVYVLPSIREGLPIALLEAMACALPCIASELPGSTDVLIESGRSGLLVPPDDTSALTRALSVVLSDPAAAARLGAAARAVVESHYSIDATAPAWLDAYRLLSFQGRG
jgi:glycosyltransferase involved in cell wall biosynthesis